MSAIEMSIFKLNGYSAEDFIKANEEVDSFLKRQPGFQSRTIAEQENGTMIDLLIWNSVEEGQASAELLLVELKDSPVHSMIDQKTVTWVVAPIQHQVN